MPLHTNVMRSLNWRVLSSALFIFVALPRACLAQGPASDVETFRQQAMQAATTGCVAAMVDRTVNVMLMKARARGLDNMTEADARASLATPAIRRGIEGVCRCIVEDVRGKLARATTSEEIEKIVRTLQLDPASTAPDLDAIGACSRAALGATRPDLSDNAVSRHWTSVGTFPEGEAYVDESSVEVLADDKVKLWTRTVFAHAKPLDDLQVLSLNTLSIYDCREARFAMAGYVAYADRESTKVVAQALRHDASAEFGPLPADDRGISGALQQWASARLPAH